MLLFAQGWEQFFAVRMGIFRIPVLFHDQRFPCLLTLWSLLSP
uniref:Uncharacterized protein n=1 Tax=Rhizophora mucronata TaxID=61149 RepID=A0A2P2N686_RHIMU